MSRSKVLPVLPVRASRPGARSSRQARDMPPQPTPEPYSAGSGGRTVSAMSTAVPPSSGIACEPVDGTGRRSPPLPGGAAEHLAGGRQERLTHVHRVPARSASPAPWPEWVTPTLYAALTQAGLPSLWSHQLEAAEAAHAGTTSCCRPERRRASPSATCCRPSPTSWTVPWRRTGGARPRCTWRRPRPWPTTSSTGSTGWPCPGCARPPTTATPRPRTGGGSGSTPNYVLTNPDLLHHSLLPGHEHWAPFLRALRYVVVDECHVYRGVFGSHLAMVLRRLRRVCARYRSDPTFVLASATVADPASTPPASSVCRCGPSPRTARHGRRSPSASGSPARPGMDGVPNRSRPTPPLTPPPDPTARPRR